MTDRSAYLTSVTVGNSKEFVVPDNRSYQLLSGSLRITTTATVGNRTPRVRLEDDVAGEILQVDGSLTVAASQTDAAFGDITEAAASELTIVPHAVGPGGKIVVSDLNNVDAGDTLEARLVALVRHA